MVSQPKPPSAQETASAQAGMNRDVAITQQQLNQTNQVTPYGNLTYSQTGSAFSPSDTGQQYWYNANTGEYSQSGPKITGYSGGSSAPSKSSLTGLSGRSGPGQNTGYSTALTSAAKGSSQGNPIYEQGWSQVKGNLTPQYTATTTLSPEQQAILDQTNGAQLNLSTLANNQSAFLKDYLGKGIDLSGAPALQSSLGSGYQTGLGSGYQTSLGAGYQTGVGDGYQTTYNTDFSADRQKVEDSLMQRQQPALEQNRDQLRTQLIASGIRPGTAAYNSEMARLSSSENDARLATIAAGGQEQSRLVGLEAARAGFTNDALLNKANFGNTSTLNAAQFGNTSALNQAQFGNQAILNQANFGNAARGQYLNEAYAQRNQPISEISALLSGSQVQNPNFVSTPQTQVAGTDYAGLVQNQYNAESKNAAAMNGGIFGLLSGGIGLLSDRRAKDNIVRVGTLDNGLPVYSYTYKGETETQIGLMADEVSQIKPHAVNVGADGLSRVRYDLAVENN